MGRETGQVSPVTLVLLTATLLYFTWRDLQLYISVQSWSCTTNSSVSLSVKYLLQPPTIHYVELPLSEMLERRLCLSYFVSPNFVSVTGVVLGHISALLISRGGRLPVLGVMTYKLRDLGDSLDGVLARGLGSAMVIVCALMTLNRLSYHPQVPTPGTKGYYFDGWCDILSEALLIYSVAHLIHRERSKQHLVSAMSRPSLLSKLCAPLRWEIWSLGLQGILSAVAWNWTTEQLHFILEANNSVSPTQLAAPKAWMVVFLWRLLNPHMLTQALLVSLLLERPTQWVEMAKYVVSLPLLCLCAYSYLLVYTLKIEHK